MTPRDSTGASEPSVTRATDREPGQPSRAGEQPNPIAGGPRTLLAGVRSASSRWIS
jgi:hypothetical protein